MKDKPDFIGHKKFSMDYIHKNTSPLINNIIVEPKAIEDVWIKETTEKNRRMESLF